MTFLYDYYRKEDVIMYYQVQRDESLSHHGILGQKWGIRRYQNQDGSLTVAGKARYLTSDSKTVGQKVPDHLSDVPKPTLKTARKDAKETAEAKMFYGEGAGNRRKLIANTVKQRSKDPYYKKAYDYYLENEDMAKAAQKARVKRASIDTRQNTVKTAKQIVKMASTITATAATAYYLAHQTGVDKIIADMAKKTVDSLR